MTNRPQQQNRISRLHRAAAGVVLGLVIVLVSVAITNQQAQTFTTLLSFDGTDGGNPFGTLIQASNGYMYGTTASGGHADDLGQLRRDGRLRVLRSSRIQDELEIANTQANLGTAYLMRKDLTEAQELLQRAIPVQEKYLQHETLQSTKDVYAHVQALC
jgi:hypothetical protein